MPQKPERYGELVKLLPDGRTVTWAQYRQMVCDNPPPLKDVLEYQKSQDVIPKEKP